MTPADLASIYALGLRPVVVEDLGRRAVLVRKHRILLIDADITIETLRDVTDGIATRKEPIQASDDTLALLTIIGLRVIEADWLQDTNAMLLHKQAALLVSPEADLDQVADWALAASAKRLAEVAQ
ncbi:hypothetical protein [Micropruina sp.]|uniref:hypothetical protein n=1 Tax=Micropruina sp. TaxID=2737536 RepID=UPI0039E5CFEC